LEDMQTSAEAIARYIDGLSESEFLANSKEQDAVVRRIEIIGEAASRLIKADAQYALHFPNMPIKDIKAMRNKVAHGYDKVSAMVVWRTARTDVPALLKEFSSILEARQLAKTVDWVQPGSKKGLLRFDWNGIADTERNRRMAIFDAHPAFSKAVLAETFRERDPKGYDAWVARGQMPEPPAPPTPRSPTKGRGGIGD
jgi:uncharacterized protein with HEPN domain